MFGIDSPELLVIAVVALVVIGPKELPGLLKTWGRWMAQMRGMATEFRGHVDEMVRQSELDQVKKQLTDASTGIDLQSLDPTREIKDMLQEGVAEGEKALADAKVSLDNPLAEPDSAPQVAVEPPPEVTAELASDVTVEPPSTAPDVVAEAVSPAEAVPEPEPVPEPAPHPVSQADKPKAAAAG